MIRIILYFIGLAGVAAGLAWLADRPGNLVIDWQGYVIETSVFRAIVMLLFLLGLTIVLWTLLRQLLASPGSISRVFRRRRERHGLEALSSGMIAIGAGDRSLAARYAVQARKAMPNEPLTDLLRAQAAQLIGDRATARRIFEGMLGAPDTELLGLRGLFLEAQREKETIAARQFAERAVRLNPKLAWAVDALFELQCKQADWAGALETLTVARKNGHVEKADSERRRAVLLTAQAMVAQDREMDKALTLATEAHNLAPDLVPAAEIAGRLYASRGNTAKAAAVVAKTWKRSPHPDLANAYAHARPGDSATDRLRRVKELAAITPNNREAPIALAIAAIEAHNWPLAREALEPLLEKRLSQRVCVLMARIEGGQHGDTGRVREWLARAVHAPRDPAWVADGHISDQWSPVSPVSGALDAYEWKVPVEEEHAGEAGALLMAELRQLQSSESIQAAAELKGERTIEMRSGEMRSGEMRSGEMRPTPVTAPSVQPVQPDAGADDDVTQTSDSAASGQDKSSGHASTDSGAAGRAAAGAAGNGAAGNGAAGNGAAGNTATGNTATGAAVNRSGGNAAGAGVSNKSEPVHAASKAQPSADSAARPVVNAGGSKSSRAQLANIAASGSKPAASDTADAEHDPDSEPEAAPKAAALKSLPAPAPAEPQAAASGSAGSGRASSTGSATSSVVSGAQSGVAPSSMSGSSGSAPMLRKKLEEPQIFVSPRAPDDPGTDAGDPDEVLTPLARFRMPTVKSGS